KEEKIEKLLSEAGKNINLEIDDLGKNSNLLTYAKKYARSRKKLTLLYHYRSKYPELIEFSNQAFYNGILQIVSASEIRKKEDTLPIEYHHQDKGYWINNENEVEARYIANLLRTLPKDKEVGIITFNVKQRDLLIDLIGEGNNTSSQKDSFKGFRTDKELRGKRKYRVYGRCDAKFSMKKNQPETETGKISILINQLYLLDKLGMDKQEFADINFDKLINTIAHELAHAYQDTIHIRKPDNAIKSQCESSGKKDRNEESCRVEKNNDNKSLSEKENCEYCGKIKSYNCCERNLQAQNKSNNLFIKNLEEVQGDERDIIIFSIGYARNEEGKFYLRFGPLGQKGGEKRLNVAISRAREKIIIVTSLLPNDLNRITDEDENRNLGPKLFKKYLEYAYYCGKNQPERVQGILKKLPGIANSSLYEKDSGLKDFDSLFEEKIYNELVKNIERYEVHKQVKSVGYHIDLAI
ncbi:7924_t:CDS:2, partial [Funneliformis geosporum]